MIELFCRVFSPEDRNSGKTSVSTFNTGLLLLSTLLIFSFSTVFASDEVVLKSVVFYKTDCPDCQVILTSTLPSIKEKYKNQLRILAINNTYTEGGSLYLNVLLKMNIPFSHQLPLLLIGTSYLSGIKEISDKLPQLIEKEMKRKIIGWPLIPGLEEILNEIEKNPQPGKISWIEAGYANRMVFVKSEILEKFSRDYIGNTVAVTVLLGMIICMFRGLFLFFKPYIVEPGSLPIWLIPLLSLTGLCISGYLAYTGATGAEAVCGPIGDCNTVRQSSYAYLFGKVQVSIPGFISYLIIFVTWCLKEFTHSRLKDISTLIIWGISTSGVVFFIYLTFLEPFVIGATCAWCLSAAVVMTCIMVSSTNPARVSWNRLYK